MTDHQRAPKGLGRREAKVLFVAGFVNLTAGFIAIFFLVSQFTSLDLQTLLLLWTGGYIAGLIGVSFIWRVARG
jgi:hypothetical protein